MTAFYEDDIKAAIINYLRKKTAVDSDTLIASEFPISQKGRRADIVIPIGDALHVFEVKSDMDSLARLAGQIGVYLSVFDKVTVVATSKHIARVLKSTPKNVEVWEVQAGELSVCRRGRKKLITDRASLSGLVRLVKLRQLVSGSVSDAAQLNRQSIEAQLNRIAIARMRRLVLAEIEWKYRSPSKMFWSAVGDNQVTADHIAALSPNLGKRNAQLRNEKNRIEPVERWLSLVSATHDDEFMLKWARLSGTNPLGMVPESARTLLKREY